MPDWFFYAGTLLTFALYSAFLEWLDKSWEPDGTILVVFFGVVGVGCWVGARMRWGIIPLELTYEQLVWWVCWQWVWFFCWAAAPIAIWQIIQMRQRFLNALRYARGE